MISDDVVAFLRSRPISMLCTRDRQNQPALHECILAEVTSHRVIGLVPEHLGRNLRENVADNGEAALLVSRAPGDHRSVQMKGKITDLGDPRVRADDFALAAALLLPMFTAYMPEPPARAMLQGMTRQSVFRVQLDVAHVFDQSPGPNAGRAIPGDAR